MFTPQFQRFALVPLALGLQTAVAAAVSTAVSPMATLPLRFEPLEAESSAAAAFQARGAAYQILVKPTEARLVFPGVDGQGLRAQAGIDCTAQRRVSIELVRGSSTARVRGDAKLPGNVNYLIGADPARWRTGINLYSRVVVEQVYPGVDVTYYGNERRLEYDFNVAPGADPDVIQLRVHGADKLEIGEQGELMIRVGDQVVTQPRPVLYELNHGRREVNGGYVQKDSNTVGFWLGPRDPRCPLVIDPVLSYARFFGGNSSDSGTAVKVDDQGFIYIAGQTLSTEFPLDGATNGFAPHFQGGTSNGDAFVAKFDNSGSNLVYFTYLGGRADDGAFDLAVDGAGHAYVTGFTDSPDFPVAPAGGVPGLAPRIGGVSDPVLKLYPTDAFVAELAADGASLVFSTYLGGSDADVAGGIAVDPAANVYVTGNTYSTNFPVANPLVYTLGGATNTLLNRLAGSNDVFVTKIAAQGTGLVYSTYLGGAKSDEGGGIAADAEGYAYLTGYTASTNFPVTPNAWQTNLNGATNPVTAYKKHYPPYDAFFARIAPLGGELAFSTLFGGTNNDTGFRIALDSARNAFITGSTYSTNFPVTNGVSLQVGITNAYANSDVFLVKFSPAGVPLFSTVFGQYSHEVGWDVAVDPLTGNPYVVGITSSTNFPTASSDGFPTPTNASLGIADVFVSAFTGDGSAFLYSVLLGGTLQDFGYAIAVDPGGNAYVVGRTSSTNFATAASVSALQGTNDTFLAKISLEPTLSAAVQGDTVTLKWPGFAPEYNVETRLNSETDAAWSVAGQATVVSNGWHAATVPATNPASLFRLRRR